MPLPEAETSFLEANEIAPADYQVVEHINIEQLTALNYLARHDDVLW